MLMIKQFSCGGNASPVITNRMPHTSSTFIESSFAKLRQRGKENRKKGRQTDTQTDRHTHTHGRKEREGKRAERERERERREGSMRKQKMKEGGIAYP